MEEVDLREKTLAVSSEGKDAEVFLARFEGEDEDARCVTEIWGSARAPEPAPTGTPAAGARVAGGSAVTSLRGG